MSLFVYEALDRRGKKQKGEIEAASERVARQLLKKRNLVIRRITAVSDKSRRAERASGALKLNASETAIFLEQLATLTAAGMTLTEALGSIAESMEGKRGRRVVAAIRQSVLEGSSLAQALQQQQFEEVICNMVAAGEETGQLEAVAVRLSELLTQRQQLQQDLLSATLYPAIILGFGIIVMLFLLAVVVPQVVSVFEHTGGELPWLTKMVIALSEFLRDKSIYLLLVLVMLIVGWRFALRLEHIRWQRDQLYLSLPLLGPLLAKIEVARFARTLGMLMTGNVPVLAALHIANQNWSLLPLRKVGLEAGEIVREGGSLAQALNVHPCMPHLAYSMMDVGEKSGSLDKMLVRVADHFERDVSRVLKRFLTIAEPILVLFMALCVGTLALAILLPIAEMNELVR